MHQRHGKFTEELELAESRLGLGKLPKRLLPDGTTIISGLCLFIATRSHIIGWAMHGLAPTKTITSDSSKSLYVYGGASKPKDCLYATTAVAIHCLVFPSPWIKPIPNFASAPKRAISSVAICPVLKKCNAFLPIPVLNTDKVINESLHCG